MFHKVVWQHMQELVRFLISFFANLPKKSSSEKLVNRLKFDRIMAVSLWPHFLANPVYAT